MVHVSASDCLFISDFQRHDILQVNLQTGVVRSYAGGGKKKLNYFGGGEHGHMDASKSGALFHYPWGIDADSSGNLYVADFGNHRIRCVTASRSVFTIAGHGKAGHRDREARFAKFSFPFDLIVAMRRRLYVSEMHGIRKVDLQKGIVSPVTGGRGHRGFKDGSAADALFHDPCYLCEDSAGLIYVADCGNHRIRMISADLNKVVTVSGSGRDQFLDGPAPIASFRRIQSMGLDHVAESLYVIDDCRLRVINVQV